MVDFLVAKFAGRQRNFTTGNFFRLTSFSFAKLQSQLLLQEFESWTSQFWNLKANFKILWVWGTCFIQTNVVCMYALGSATMKLNGSVPEEYANREVPGSMRSLAINKNWIIIFIIISWLLGQRKRSAIVANSNSMLLDMSWLQVLVYSGAH